MEHVIAFIALTAMEIVLGIDNIVFIAVITARLPEHQQPKARRWGLMLALVTRILLLFTLSFVVTRLTGPLFHLTDLGLPDNWLPSDPETLEEINVISVKDLILVFGGLFLIAKSTVEIHAKVEGKEHETHSKGKVTMASVLFQIAVLDIVFSLDSVITAVGMAKSVYVMSTAVVVAVIVMLIFAERVSAFVHRNPTIKMLALAFLLLIGVMLVAEGIGTAIDKGYIYFAMGFSLLVEALNMRMRTKGHQREEQGSESQATGTPATEHSP